ncbi:four helix bundle protein [Roseivirga thermotolerans]|nr:four helix bundle protein [Roseivirga thermotolerans]
MIKRQRQYVLSSLRMIEELPNGYTYGVTGRQLTRCSTSVGANYRAACRAKSSADFINKLKIVEEEADECLYFMDLLTELNGTNLQLLKELMKEGDEILAIVVASIKTASANRNIKN